MLRFKAVRYRNFMSTGNQFIEIFLDTFDKTLMIGKNGHGKSTMYLALYWGLFGKTFDISLNTAQVINSINAKRTEVEVEFSIGSTEYKVVRGLKPNKFEIYIDGELKPQDATIKDYQKFLDTNILKMSSKTFQQIVILGSKQYTPFMRLKAKERRSVVEDLLDIQYFSIMSNIIKARASAIKEDYTELVNDIRQLDTKIELTQVRVDELNNHNDNIIATNNKEQAKLKVDVTNQSDIKDKNTTAILELNPDKLNTDLQDLRDKSTEIVTFKTKIGANKSSTETKIKFFHEKSECPSCEQDIPHTHKDKVLSTYQDKVAEYNTGIKKADDLISDMNKDIDSISSQLLPLSTYIENVRNADTQLSILKNSIDNLVAQNLKLSESVDTTEDEDNIKNMSSELVNLTGRRDSITTDLRYYTAIVELLKDGGIKTKIVEQYVPVINSLISKYLSILEFDVEFVLDNEFKETIKSRGRDIFSYGNFSDGQKIRIDLALLFTFREVSRMKNSASTNLLIMDEIADGSMDSDGIDDLVRIINSKDNEQSNIFVISHNDKIIEHFDNTIKFVMKNNFTELSFENEYK